MLWTAALVGFGALNVYAFAAGGLPGLVDYLGRLGPWGILAPVDLLLALLVGVHWIRRDARTRGVSPLPFLALTLATGSLGLLLYMAIHGGRGAAPAGTGERRLTGVTSSP